MRNALVRLAALFGIVAFAFACQISVADDTGVNLLPNGGFKQVGKTGGLSLWTLLDPGAPAVVGTDSNGSFITIKAADPTDQAGLQQVVPIKPEWSKLLLRGSLRVDALAPPAVPVPSSTPAVSIVGDWLNRYGQVLAPANLQSWSAATPDWADIDQLVTVPAGAAGLRLSPEISHATGTADFRNLSLVAFVETFDDEFDGTAVDPARWSISTGKHNVNADEAQWFDPSEVSVSDGVLKLHAEQKQNGDYQYQSGEILSTGKFQQLYGLFEFRLKLPMTVGGWPAAYLLAWDDAWPPEIDVEELSGRDQTTVLETNHYVDDYGRHQASQVNWDGSGVDRTQWHTYSVVWEAGKLAWYFDGTFKGVTGHPDANVSNVPMYVRLNLAVGAFGGDPTRGTWPQDFLCDYVHVYQRSDYGLPVYPENSQEITLPAHTATLAAISCSPMMGAVATWSLVSGPGKAFIKDPHALNTSVSLAKAGMYEFSLRVANGATSSAAPLLVYVNSPLGGRS